MDAQNLVVLTGEITKIYPERKTPHGITIVSFVLEHNSIVHEAGVNCSVKCRIYCIMLDQKPTHKELIHQQVKVQGFLSQNSKAQLVVHINQLDIFE